jgi:hypothetical protein
MLKGGLSYAEEKLGLAHVRTTTLPSKIAPRRLDRSSAVSSHSSEIPRRFPGCAMLLASGRGLPTLPNILASRALVHTAEGQFFRRVVREACERCRIPVVGFRERELG